MRVSPRERGKKKMRNSKWIYYVFIKRTECQEDCIDCGELDVHHIVLDPQHEMGLLQQ